METLTIDHDIMVFFLTADSFPDGIMDAHNKLHALAPVSPGRRYFGISRPENGVIAYKAAAEEVDRGEAEKQNLDTLVIKKGKYICLTIYDYAKNIQSISESFKELLAHPEIDPEGYCVEWYLGDKDVRCMVRLQDANVIV